MDPPVRVFAGDAMLKFGKKKTEASGEAEAPATEEGAEGAPAKKKPPVMLIAAAAALVLLGGGGAGAWFLFLKPKPASAEAHGEGAPAPATKAPAAKAPATKGGQGASAGEGAGQVRAGPDGVTFYTLPDLIVNIQTADGRPTFLKLRLTLEMSDPYLASTLQAEYPRLQDMFQGFLRELRPEDLHGSAGSHQLRQEILRRVNLIAAPGHIDAVLIEEMLVQ